MRKKEKTMATSQAESQTSAHPIRHIAIQLTSSIRPVVHSSMPVRGGMKASGSDSDRSEEFTFDSESMRGSHNIFILTREGDQGEETPVFPLRNASVDGILVFTHREAAFLYLQIAEWTTYQLREVSPLELEQWVPALTRDHVAFLIVNANRHHQVLGDTAQRAINVQALQDLTGENLYQEILAAS